VGLVFVREKGNTLSGPPGSASSPDSVNVIFDRQGESYVDDELSGRILPVNRWFLDFRA
jgi:hypothetical protein